MVIMGLVCWCTMVEFSFRWEIGIKFSIGDRWIDSKSKSIDNISFFGISMMILLSIWWKKIVKTFSIEFSIDWFSIIIDHWSIFQIYNSIFWSKMKKRPENSIDLSTSKKLDLWMIIFNQSLKYLILIQKKTNIFCWIIFWFIFVPMN